MTVSEVKIKKVLSCLVGISILVGIILLLSVILMTSSAHGAKIILEVNVDDSTSGSVRTRPEVVLLSTKILIEKSQDAQNRWVYDVEFNQELEAKFLLQLKEEIPARLFFHPLQLAIPFTEDERTFLVRLGLVPIEGSNTPTEARKLRDIDVTKLSDEQLPIFYQRARVASKKRLEELRRGRSLHGYDVWVIYKYLEVIREMNNRLYVLPPNDIYVERDWLQNALQNNEKRVRNSVGKENARLLIQQTDANEAERFRKLWNLIKNVDDCKKRYHLLKSYDQLLLSVPTSERIDRIKGVTGVFRGTILSAIAQCITVNIHCYSDEDEFKEPIPLLTELIDQLKNERLSTRDDLRNRLSGDIAVLSDLKTAIEEGLPFSLSCSDVLSTFSQ